MAKSDILRKFIYKIGGDDPRNRNFLLAQGLQATAEEQKSLFSDLMSYHGSRINKYRYYWDMYNGNHWFSANPDTQQKLQINYCFKVVNKHTAFLMNKGFLIESSFPEIEKFLQTNWKLNLGGVRDYNLFGLELGIQGGVFGDTWVNAFTAQNKITLNPYIKYEILDGTKSFPVINRGKVIGFLYYGAEDVVSEENFGFARYGSRFEGYYYKAGSRTRIVEEEFYEPERFDLIDLPITHFKNFPSINSYYGVSDLSQIVDLNLLFDKTITDIQDVIDYHASPVTVLLGGKAGDLIRGANRVWSIPNEKAKITNLELNGDLVAASSHINRLRESILDQANIPNKIEHISNTSASSLAIQFMPLYETMEMKRIMYGVKLLELNALTIKLGILTNAISVNKVVRSALKRWKEEYGDAPDKIKKSAYPFSRSVSDREDFDSLSAFYSGRIPKEIFETFITWFPPLPRDEKIALDSEIAAINNNIHSLRHGRSILGMSESESYLMDKEIETEMKKNPKLSKSVTVTNKTGLGNPDVTGEKNSIAAQQKL